MDLKPGGMPDLGTVFRMAQTMAQGAPPAAKRKRKTPGPLTLSLSVLVWWATAGLAAPFSRAGHSLGNFFVHDPIQAAAGILVGLALPQLRKVKR